MSLHWTVLEEKGAFRGLELAGIRRNPSLRLEVAGWRRLRLASKDGAIFLARLDNDWEGWSRLSNPDVRVAIVPKISAPDVRAVGEAAGTDAWWLGWARWFATQLGKSPNSPLFPAPWWLEPVRGQATRRPWFDPSIPQPAGWRATLDDLGVHEVEPLQANQILALRPPSAANTDRVKVWRKHARAGTLPPVLLWFLPSALDVFLVLDGHDRLQAAAAEKVEPRFLKLASAENVEQPTRDLQAMMSGIERALASPNSRMKDTTSLNTMLIDAHRTSSRRLCARAWPMKGKAAAWEKEVRAVARALGVSPEIVGMLDAAP